jgi:hypothetical protein
MADFFIDGKNKKGIFYSRGHGKLNYKIEI